MSSALKDISYALQMASPYEVRGSVRTITLEMHRLYEYAIQH